MFKYEWLLAFYHELRAHGFVVGAAEQKRVHHLLLQLQAVDAFPKSSVSLCNMLSAVLSINDEQQQHFRQIFQRFFAPLLSSERREVNRFENIADTLDREQEIGEEPDDKSTRRVARNDARRFHIRVATAMLIALFLLAVLPHVVIVRGGREVVFLPHQTPLPEQTPLPKQTPLPAVPVPSTGPPASQPSDRTQVQQWMSHLGEKAKKVVGSTNIVPESWLGIGILILTFLPFAALALWAAAPSKRQDTFITRRKTEGKPELLKLLLTASSYNPFERDGVHRAVQELRRPRMLECDEIDVEQTMVASLRNAGMFTPVYAQRPVAPEYLVLIERNGRADHVTRYAECLFSVLRASQIYIEIYYFEGDCRRVFRANESPRISLEELIGRHSDHRLILITKGNGILNPVSGKIENWAFLVTQFARRVCLTPSPPELWGYRELAISTAFDCTVLPLLPQSMSLAVEILSSEDDSQVRKWAPQVTEDAREAVNRLADLLEDRPSLWLSSVRPSEQILKAMESAARDALQPEGYRWLTACAIYPELTWNMTLHLGNSLQGADGKPLIEPDRLLMLAMLPWFREGNMPVWLRSRFANSMSVAEFRTVRSILSRLLLSIFEFSRRTTPLSLVVDRPPLAASSVEENVSAVLGDTLLAEFLAKPQRLDRTRFKLPASVSAFLQSGSIARMRRHAKPDASVQAMQASAEALRTTLTEAEIEKVTVVRGPHPEFGEQAGYRPVLSFVDRSGTEVGMRDQYFLFWSTGASMAYLLDVDTVTILLHRTRVVTRMAIVNFVLIATAAFYFADNIVRSYDHDAIAIGVVCMWMLAPYWLMNFLVLHRFKSCLKSFPTFTPWHALIHKATQFAFTPSRVQEI